MNPIIASYFDEIEMHLIESPVVASYKQVRREVTPTDGKLRIRATLIDGSLFEHPKEGPPQSVFDVPNAMTTLTTIEDRMLGRG